LAALFRDGREIPHDVLVRLVPQRPEIIVTAVGRFSVSEVTIGGADLERKTHALGVLQQRHAVLRPQTLDDELVTELHQSVDAQIVGYAHHLQHVVVVYVYLPHVDVLQDQLHRGTVYRLHGHGRVLLFVRRAVED